MQDLIILLKQRDAIKQLIDTGYDLKHELERIEAKIKELEAKIKQGNSFVQGS